VDYYTDPRLRGKSYSTASVKEEEITDDLNLRISKGHASGVPITTVFLGFSSEVGFCFSGVEKEAIDLLITPSDSEGLALFQASCDKIVAFCMARMPPATLYGLVGCVKRRAFDAGKDEAQQEMQRALGLKH
jgi:hypothetical protein